jgi:Ca2+/Na+ antiporter
LGIALGSASQIALFVAPVLVLLSYVIGPAPMDLRFWPGAVVMMLIASLTASLVTNSGRSAWFVGVLVLMVYLIFALTLYMLHLVPADRQRSTFPETQSNPIAVILTLGVTTRMDKVAEFYARWFAKKPAPAPLGWCMQGFIGAGADANFWIS